MAAAAARRWLLSPVRLFGHHHAVKYRGSRLPNHYVMCRAASSGAGDSAESCWGEFFINFIGS